MNIEVEILAHTEQVVARTPLFELISLRLSYPRFIHSEVMTYRRFARCFSSSRAVPSNKLLDKVRTDPVMPPKFGASQSGMNMGAELEGEDLKRAQQVWRTAARGAADASYTLSKIGAHKSLGNRLTEPFVNITGVVTGELGEWLWFLKQRLAKDADPAIQELALKIQEVLSISTPSREPIHLPYITIEEKSDYSLEHLKLISAARCARSSYTPFGSPKKDTEKDLKLAGRLVEAGHFSPFEHQCEPTDYNKCNYEGPFKNWVAFRSELDNKTNNWMYLQGLLSIIGR